MKPLSSTYEVALHYCTAQYWCHILYSVNSNSVKLHVTNWWLVTRYLCIAVWVLVESHMYCWHLLRCRHWAKWMFGNVRMWHAPFPPQYPTEQFFHTDYRPLLRDRQHNVLDEQVRVFGCSFMSTLYSLGKAPKVNVLKCLHTSRTFRPWVFIQFSCVLRCIY